MKIIIASEIFPPDIGGPARYADILSERLVSGGRKVCVITYSDTSSSEEDRRREYPVYRIVRGRNVLVRYFKYFIKLFQITTPSDVIYAQGPLSGGLPAVLVGKIKRMKVTVKVVGDQVWERAHQGGQTSLLLDDFQNQPLQGRLWLMRKVQNFVLSQADVVITVSKYFKDIIKKWGIDDKKIKVIYNSVSEISGKGIDTGRFEKYFEHKVVFSAGRLVKWKGFDTLIDVMKDLDKDYVLCIAGDGPERENLEKMVKDLGLEKRVYLLGRLNRGEVGYFLSKCFVFVLNSGYENCSHIILEAMQKGACILASRIGGNPELIEDGVSGFLFDYNDKGKIKELIHQISKDKGLYTRLRENAKKRFAQFSWSEVVAKTLDIIS